MVMVVHPGSKAICPAYHPTVPDLWCGFLFCRECVPELWGCSAFLDRTQATSIGRCSWCSPPWCESMDELGANHRRRKSEMSNTFFGHCSLHRPPSLSQES